MKILHCNSHENEGGAAIAVQRLHEALNLSGQCKSIFGVQQKKTNAENVVEIPVFPVQFVQELAVTFAKASVKLCKKQKEVFITNYLNPNAIHKSIAKIQPDIIHLHWVSNFISPWVLKKIAKLNIPVVWTLHDTWAFTGGCHYFGQCNKWQGVCQNCPALRKPLGLDMANLQWKLKQACYEQLNPTLIGLSKHFKNDIEKSSLLKNYLCVNLPNPINIKEFDVVSKVEARALLGLEQDVKYILFGAMSATSDLRKGFDLLKTALQYTHTTHPHAHCLIFGTTKGYELPLASTYLGRIEEIKKLALAYAAADVFVCPSREESFSQTTLEALACGTAVVGFDIGGLPDMIKHKANGYIAKPYDTKDLAHGISYVLEDDTRREQMGKVARKTVEDGYSYPVIAKKYIELYKGILAKKNDVN